MICGFELHQNSAIQGPTYVCERCDIQKAVEQTLLPHANIFYFANLLILFCQMVLWGLLVLDILDIVICFSF